MRYALVDCRISEAIATSLEKYADVILRLPPFPALAPSVASHPDMLVWIYGKSIVTYRDYYALAPHVFQALSEKYEITFAEETAGARYPSDVALNCAVIGSTLLANTNTVSKKIKALGELYGLYILHTNQGYAKCSTVVVSEGAIISADASICALAQSAGLDVLRIREGHVRLDGYAYGFLGGASGTTEDTVVFTGDISRHPDTEAIIAFCQNHGKRAVSLSHDELYDYGTVMLV